MNIAHVYEFDKGYEGCKKITVPGYLLTEPGIMKLVKSKSKYFLTIDCDRQAILIHTKWQDGAVKHEIPLSNITHMTVDMSFENQDRFYTKVTSKDRLFIFMFKNPHDWFKFTDIFSHIHQGGQITPLLESHENYEEFAARYAGSQGQRKYEEDRQKVVNNIPDDKEKISSEEERENHHKLHFPLIHGLFHGKDNKKSETELRRQEENKFDPNSHGFDKTVAVNVINADASKKIENKDITTRN